MTRRVRTLLLATLLAAATLASHAPALYAGFIDIDDADYVPENETVKAGLGLEGVAWAFDGAHAGNWFPLTWLSHMSDVELFGVEPAGHHGMNVALHVANAVLLFLMLASITGELLPSVVVAALFALHPVSVESVAWISQRKTTLSTLFGILAIWGYARYVRGGRWLAYAGSLLGYALSLLSKQMFVTLPFALLLLDYWPLRRAALDPPPGRLPTPRSLLHGALRLLPEKIPYALLAVAASAAAVASQGEAISTGATFPLSVRIGNALISYVRYLGLLFWPARLSVFYPLSDPDVTLAKVLASVVLLLAVTALAWRLGRTRRHLLVGWLWFVGTLVPVIGLVQVGAQAMADRYAYVPFWGLLLAIVWEVWDRVRSAGVGTAPRAAVAALTCVLLLGLGLLTFRQAEKWRDTITLLEDAVAGDDANFIAHRMLAGQYFNRGEYARALRHAEAGMRSPRDPGEILPIYGMALYQTGATERAVEILEESTRVAPKSVLGFTNLAWVYTQLGRYDRATEVLTAALEIEPENVRAARLLATTEARQGNFDAAAAGFGRVVALAPLDFDARMERAKALARVERFAEAEQVLRDALEAARDSADPRRDALLSTLRTFLASVLVRRGDVAGGIAQYDLALAGWDENFAANNNLAWLLATTPDPAHRDPSRAGTLAERAVLLSKRRDPNALATLAAAYAAADRRADAADATREAIGVAREAGDAPAAAALEAQLRTYEDAAAPAASGSRATVR